MGMKLTVVREESQYEGALAVIAPVLEDIPAELHNEITREARKGRHAQKVRDIAGKMIGRVPANICKILSQGLDDQIVLEISA